MNVNTIKRCLVGAALISVAALNTQAGVIDCPANVATLVSNTSACQYSDSATQDFLNTDPMTVNAEAFFGVSDWAFIGKSDGVNATSGNWTLGADSWDAFDNIMMIFKSGRDTTLVGYLLNEGATNGTWESPFSAPLFDVKNTRDVSHMSFYGRESIPVPEPSLLILLLLGLGSIALSRLRTG